MNLRRLGPCDGALWRQAVSALVPADERSGELLDMDESEAALRDERCYLLVASEGSRCIGLLAAFRFPDVECGGSMVYLYDIEVDVRDRRQGIGRSMVSHLITLCEVDEVDLIWAGTDVSNRPARRTFESTGAALEGSSYAEYEWDLEQHGEAGDASLG